MIPCRSVPVFICLLTLVALSIVPAGCSEQALSPTDHVAPLSGIVAPAPGVGRLAVMTRNVYVGTDVDRILAGSLAEVPARVSEGYQQFLDTDFATRAEALALEIEAGNPHLVGLQEVSIVRGFFATGIQEHDFMPVLLEALSDRGLNYELAVQNRTTEVTLPADPTVFPGLLGVELVDSDAILVRGDVIVSEAEAYDYQARLPVPGAGFDILRGYVSVNATIGPRSVRFVNTHVEPAPIPELLPVQLGQIQELLQILEAESLPVILVGDFNSPAHLGEANAPGYAALLEGGFVDLWMRQAPGQMEDGGTCCHDPDLSDPDSQLDQRLDLVLVRSDGSGPDVIAGKASVEVVGDSPEEWNRFNLWASDHAGLLARFQIPGRQASEPSARLYPDGPAPGADRGPLPARHSVLS